MSATEYNDSRLGVVGSNGTAFVRRFRVEDPQDANGVAVEPAYDAELLRKAKIGTEFPGMPGAVCTEYDVREKLDSSNWNVEALYDVPSILNPGAGGAWRVRMSGSLDTQFTSVVRLTEEERTGKEVPLQIGPFQFKRWPLTIPPPSEDFLWFTTTDSDGKEITLTVPRDPKKQQRIPVGMDYYPPTTVVTCSRRFQDASALRSMKIQSAHGAVNDGDFNILGRAMYTRGQVILADHEIVEVIGNKQDQPLEHDITIVFAVRFEGWQEAVVHTYCDDNETGTACAIVYWQQDNPNPGDPRRVVAEDLRRQFWFKFEGFLEGL